MRKQPKILAGVVFGALILALGASCGGRSGGGNRNANANNADNNKDAPISVTSGKAVSREIPAFIKATGSLIADETSDVAPKVAGKIVDVAANVGQFITQGSVIAKIDDKDARLRLAEAKAGVTQAVAGVRQAEARLGLAPNGKFDSSTIPEVRAANATYEQRLAELRQAQTNEKRYRELVETGDVALITYETFRTARDTAQAQVNNAKQQLEAAVNTARLNNQAIVSAQAGVEAARTQVGTAEQALVDTVIRAPFSGYVSARPVAVGEFVTTGSIVATLLRANPIKIQLQVSEAEVGNISLGRGVSIEVDAYKDRRFAGTVTAVNPAIDPTSRSVVVEASIENNGNLLRSGMFATARITREGQSTGVFVPRAAVHPDQATQGYRVYVIVDGIVKQRTVQLGTEESDFYQVLEGVNADEIVATSNLEQLYEGAKVQIAQ
jgi:multidrug efflux pump subunit AcrA (membrane-fusion protein)